jgi:hypothetical protein
MGFEIKIGDIFIYDAFIGPSLSIITEINKTACKSICINFSIDDKQVCFIKNSKIRIKFINTHMCLLSKSLYIQQYGVEEILKQLFEYKLEVIED